MIEASWVWPDLHVLVEGQVSSLYLDLCPSDYECGSVGYYHICGPLSHIAHTHYQMDTNPGISLISNLPPKREGWATSN